MMMNSSLALTESGHRSRGGIELGRDASVEQASRGVILPGLTRRQEIGLIILLALAVRLVDFTAPYTSVHWIKQLQIAPIAKNFHQHGYNIWWPETDYSADQPNYIEIEFQLVTWLTALLYNVFGVHDWVGRLVAILFSLGAIVLMHKLLRLHLGERPATFGLLFFAFAPSHWYFGRVLMSEPAMIFFSVALVYYFSLWLKAEKLGHYLAALVSGILCFLVKLPALLLVIPLLWLAYRKYGVALFKQPALYVFALLSLVPAAAYYHHAYVDIGSKYFTVGVGFGGGMWFSPGDFLRPGNYSLILNRLLKDHLTAIGLVLLPLGFFATENGRFRWNLFHVWLGAVLLYFILVSGGNLRQTYYQIPLLLPAAGFIGLGWDRLSQTRGISRATVPVLVIIFLVLAAWGVQPFFEQYRPILDAARKLDEIDAGKQPVIIFPPGYGCLYYFQRPGWVGRETFGKPPWRLRMMTKVSPHDFPGPLYVENRRERGARWTVYFDDISPGGARPDLKHYLEDNYAAAFRSEGYTIYDLSSQLP